MQCRRTSGDSWECIRVLRSSLALRKERVSIFDMENVRYQMRAMKMCLRIPRRRANKKEVVVCYFREHESACAVLWETRLQSAKIIPSNYPEVHSGLDGLVLRPFEAFVCMPNNQ
ncbi:hypothetical protein B0T10DRAFT_297652 [Thelonectria olida]|uniref:Uncharacterized protein n=1 Tax=Thelonectria olida TaxID=1576542 RepID=A0A9P8VNF9_9HYPO|nr:hypothetical protein B0T10DRAFT_297652 [Thelonectria olida]